VVTPIVGCTEAAGIGNVAEPLREKTTDLVRCRTRSEITIHVCRQRANALCVQITWRKAAASA